MRTRVPKEISPRILAFPIGTLQRIFEMLIAPPRAFEKLEVDRPPMAIYLQKSPTFGAGHAPTLQRY